MKRFFKSEKGYIDGETIWAIFVILVLIGFFGFGIFKFIYSRTAGNKTAIDMKYNYEKAIVNLNGEKLEIEVNSWTDYDGEQIQIIAKDGTVYLVSSFNTILIGK